MLMRRRDLLRSLEAAASSQSKDATNVSDGPLVVPFRKKLAFLLAKGANNVSAACSISVPSQRFPEESTNCPLSWKKAAACLAGPALNRPKKSSRVASAPLAGGVLPIAEAGSFAAEAETF